MRLARESFNLEPVCRVSCVGLLEQRWGLQASYRRCQRREQHISRPDALVEPRMIRFDAVALAGIGMNLGRIP